ncbi:MAG: hypothetical protein EOO23_08940, partial [Comamonadaceae bacterium]
MLHILLSGQGVPALVTGFVSIGVALLLVLTRGLHGRFSMDSASGIQKVHTDPTPRIGGVAIMLGVIAGYFFATDGQKRLLGPLILAGALAFAFGLLEDLTKKVGVATPPIRG